MFPTVKEWKLYLKINLPNFFFRLVWKIKLKNKITSSIRKAKSNFYKNVYIKWKNYLRLTWNNIVNFEACLWKVNVINLIFFNNVEHYNVDSISSTCNHYFSDVEINMYNETPVSDLNSLNHIFRNESSLFLSPLTNEVYKNIIQALKILKQL